MNTPKHGLTYPDDGDQIADYPGVAQSLAETVDDALPPVGGNTDQVLTKTSGDNYATAWADVPAPAKDPQVEANADAINDLQTQVTTNAGSIATNANDIATNANDIATNANDIATNTNDITGNANAISDLTASLNGGDIGEVLTKTSNLDGEWEWLPGGGGGGGDTYPGISTEPDNQIELDTDGKLIVRFPQVNNLAANTDSGDVVLTWED